MAVAYLSSVYVTRHDTSSVWTSVSGTIHARDSTVKKSIVPSWDLAFVLQAMTLSPFEPPARVSLKMLILKTVFLVLLASGRRRSELHSIRYDTLSRDESWSHIVLKTDPSFVSKTDLANKGQKTLEVIRIPALSEIVDNSLSEDLTLCPVSALRIYRQRTKSLRKTRRDSSCPSRRTTRRTYRRILVHSGYGKLSGVPTNHHLMKPGPYTE